MEMEQNLVEQTYSDNITNIDHVKAVEEFLKCKRAATNTIHNVKLPDGSISSDPEVIKCFAIEYYKSLLSQHQASFIPELSLATKLKSEDSNHTTAGWCPLFEALVEDAWDQRCTVARESGRVPTRVITFVETRLATEVEGFCKISPNSSSIREKSQAWRKATCKGTIGRGCQDEVPSM
ncbi:hypothetical protein QJS04_geneDACA012396 [Acorus gramineus]|uniref:Uncharacterized protein n=1 Tax=Acorus gramineus TaxID=55184 RepID=A0AAV9B8W3_ACOGR|nr:hypothetical protein QJS04_geneDACA012396 [Acorus gramineus]